MDLGLAQRVFVVTGGSRGLGLACAKTLVDEGAHVVVAARDQQALDEAIGGLGSSNAVGLAAYLADPGAAERVIAAQLDEAIGGLGSSNAVGLAADLADPGAAERVIAAALARYERLDGALISVGGPAAGTPMTTDDETWRLAFESVFLGQLRVARAAANAMTGDPADLSGTRGSLAFVLSSSSRELLPGLTTSNGLRPGLAMLVKDLADELGPRGIRVNGLLPGSFATDRRFAIDARYGAPDVVRRRNESTIPLGRYGEPEEFGRAAAFVLSPMSSFISGALIPVDGGASRSL